ncbi:MAG: glycosyltransferase [SAR202 cluster bacterium]|jgi:glycosyltransferase involved in cell wall biosynthesis|nr:glycosyltransferase [SAR202 cluster bacterium]|tara:strand:+ start:833 stop:1726 length:894 start_codon:yes stop_codon:yes gene_type:complete
MDNSQQDGQNTIDYRMINDYSLDRVVGEGTFIHIINNLDDFYQPLHPKISEDVTLGIIVRDELMNPAGGILSMLNQHIDYFSNIVVMDTGSVDGTRELLEYLSGQYPHLTVYDQRFRGFAHARNKLGKKIKTKYVLALDADEMLFGKALLRIPTFLEEHSDFDVIEFNFINISPGVPNSNGHGWKGRFYNPKNISFKGFIWENHDNEPGLICTGAQIHHFLPKPYDVLKKRRNWHDVIYSKHRLAKKSPVEFKNFKDWKIPNIPTLAAYGIDVFDVIKQIEDIGIKFPDNLMPLKFN